MKQKWFAVLCAVLLLGSITSAFAQGQAGGAPGSFGGGAQSVTQGTAANTLMSDTSVTGLSYTATNSDENALRITGDITALLMDITVSKTGGTDNADACNFYGQNAAILATDGASATLDQAAITTDGSGANGVFAYDDGATVTIANSTVTTAQDHSGGIMVAGGGTIYANNMQVETQGNSAAAIRSDRGGGQIVAEGGTYTTNGTGSPAIYSTAAITVTGAALAATASEAVVVEGKNSVTLTDCTVTDNMQGTYGQSSGENIQAVMLYQSMSGDADEGRSSFTMTGGSLTALAGDLFYVTNTACTIQLRGVALTLADGTLLNVAGNDGSRGWGTAGENGGDCELSAQGQTLTGDITVDSASTLSLTLEDGTAYTGAVNPGGQAGNVTVTLDSGSTWTLTADSYITAFEGSMDAVTLNGYALHIAQA